MGKHSFYPKVAKGFKSKGYQYFDGDKDIQGKGRSHASKPDYIATIEGIIIIGEIKSPDEGPTSSSWRQIQKSDSEEFKKVRKEIARREKNGEISKELGGHKIIILGQIPDYVSKLNRTYDLPSDIKKIDALMAGYSVPSGEALNVEEALNYLKVLVHEKIDIGNGSTTYIFGLNNEEILISRRYVLA